METSPTTPPLRDAETKNAPTARRSVNEASIPEGKPGKIRMTPSQLCISRSWSAPVMPSDSVHAPVCP